MVVRVTMQSEFAAQRRLPGLPVLSKRELHRWRGGGDARAHCRS